MAESFEMSEHECADLLRRHVVGRIALSTPDGPHLVPVNYAVVDDALVVRTSPYSVLGTHGRDAVLAFEVDHVDHADQRGWSVVVRGRAEVITDPDKLDHVRTVWAPRPWVSGPRNLVLRIPWSELSGRRLGTGWSTERDSPMMRG